jgi:hypothetical protein
MIIRLLFALLLLTVAWPSVQADTDVIGSRDPLGIERFPRSWIVDYRREDTAAPREFVVGRVERSQREARVEDLLRVEGSLESAIYRIPEGIPVAEVAAHFLDGLEGGLLFRCSGRDCGRSNEWANRIFGKAILYGPDGNQQYLAWESQGRLTSVYVIERGNKRIYANVQVLVPGLTESDRSAPMQLFARRLTRTGLERDRWHHAGRGRQPCPLDAERVFAALAGQLADLALDTDLYLVCHHLRQRARRASWWRQPSAARPPAAVRTPLRVRLPPGIRVLPFGAGPVPAAGRDIRLRGWNSWCRAWWPTHVGRLMRARHSRSHQTAGHERPAPRRRSGGWRIDSCRRRRSPP